MKQFRKTPETFAGAFLVFLVVDALSERESHREKDAMEIRKSIKDFVMNSRAIKKLEYFPRIAEMAAGTVFSEENAEQIAFPR